MVNPPPVGPSHLQVNRLLSARDLAEQHGISCEVLDLQLDIPATS